MVIITSFLSAGIDLLARRASCFFQNASDSESEKRYKFLCDWLEERMNSQFHDRTGVRLYQENMLSCVCIAQRDVISTSNSRRDAFTLELKEVPKGSGFVWDKYGHIVTNYHVIQGISSLRIKLADRSTYDAKVVGFDPVNDVAVLHVDAPKDKLRPIHVGTSTNLLVGQNVYAIGDPFGLELSFTTGVISGLHRGIRVDITGCLLQDVIQTNVSMNPGNSGGPLLDGSGRLIGINTAIMCTPCGASSGVSFSIPVDTVRQIVDQWVKPILGINKFAPDQYVDLMGGSGVSFFDAPANGPAGKAGLQLIKCNNYAALVLGDIVTTMNEIKVPNGSDLYSTPDQCKVGDKILRTMEQHPGEIVLV